MGKVFVFNNDFEASSKVIDFDSNLEFQIVGEVISTILLIFSKLQDF